jgi:hypothetical protein
MDNQPVRPLLVNGLSANKLSQHFSGLWKRSSIAF